MTRLEYEQDIAEIGLLDAQERLQNNMQDIGVLQDKSQNLSGLARDENGRLLPGQRSLNPRGRKSRALELEMLRAIREAISPEQFNFYINKALEIAISQNSARSIIAVLEFASSYGLGKPVQQKIVETGKSDLIAELMKDTSPLLPPKDGNST